MNRAHLLSLMVNTPLLAHPRKAATVYSLLRGQMGLPGIELPPSRAAAAIDALMERNQARQQPEASQFVGGQPAATDGSWVRREPFRVQDGVAIITATGSMVNRGAWVGDDGSGLTSYEGIKFQIQRAAAFKGAGAIILDVETPGGQAMGAFELAATVREAAKVKPVYSVVNGMAASAGYALVSGSTRIITTPSGVSGSIGVVLLHLDQSEMLAAEGIKPTLIFAGDHKVDGNSLQPLSESVREDLQSEVKAIYQQFLQTVAAGRGSRLSQKAARETQGRTYMGQEAVDIGLADAVGTFEEVLAEAAAKVRRSGGASANRGSKMSQLGIDDQGGQQNNQSQAAATFSQAQVDQARTEGRTSGAADANARMNTILASDQVKGRERAAIDLAIKSPGMSAEDVIAFVSANVPLATAAAPGPQTPSLAERVADTGANQLSGGPVTTGDPRTPAGGGSQEAVKAGWDAAKSQAHRPLSSAGHRGRQPITSR